MGDCDCESKIRCDQMGNKTRYIYLSQSIEENLAAKQKEALNALAEDLDEKHKQALEAKEKQIRDEMHKRVGNIKCSFLRKLSKLLLKMWPKIFDYEEYLEKYSGPPIGEK